MFIGAYVLVYLYMFIFVCIHLYVFVHLLVVLSMFTILNCSAEPIKRLDMTRPNIENHAGEGCAVQSTSTSTQTKSIHQVILYYSTL